MKIYRALRKRRCKVEVAVIKDEEIESNGLTISNSNPWAIRSNTLRSKMSFNNHDSNGTHEESMHRKEKSFQSSVLSESARRFGVICNNSIVCFDMLSTKAQQKRDSVYDTLHASEDDANLSKDTFAVIKNIRNKPIHEVTVDKKFSALQNKNFCDEISPININRPNSHCYDGKEIKHACNFSKYSSENCPIHKEYEVPKSHVSFSLEERTVKENISEKHKKTKQENLGNAKSVERNCNSETTKEKAFGLFERLGSSNISNNKNADSFLSRKCVHNLVHKCLSDRKLTQTIPHSSIITGDKNEKLTTYKIMNCRENLTQSFDQLVNSIVTTEDKNKKYFLKIALLEAKNRKLTNFLEQEQKYLNIFDLHSRRSDLPETSPSPAKDTASCSCGPACAVHDLEQALCQADVHAKWLALELQKLEQRADILEKALARREAEYAALREQYLKMKRSSDKKLKLKLGVCPKWRI
ncbi:uncharacterized protein LOC134538929 isoform X2 [Bacillus rossius redtenbacheri]|uniref:uncharacterized protein LOC134538929 isoform X2 n=1 Tax=Bacillus rossius redtenbacheri TaxID=93214 RepID=UPI002FDDD049